MKKISDFFVEIAGLKWFGISLILYVFFAVVIMNNGAKHISILSGQEVEILDLRMSGYNNDTVKSILAKYTPEARTYYIKFSLIADSCYPLGYTFLFIIAITWVFKSAQKEKLLLNNIHLLPLVTVLLDFAENANIVSLVSSYPLHTVAQVKTASLFTLLKWGMVGVQSLILFYGVLLAVLFRKNRAL